MKLKKQIESGKVGMPCNYNGHTYIVMGGYDFESKTVIIQDEYNNILIVKVSELNV